MLASTHNPDRQPFRLTPDPEFVYVSPAQLDAYSRLFSGIHMQQECLLLTGDPGTGKTLLLRRLLLDLENAGIAVCAFWNSVSSTDQLWEACCERVGLKVDPSQNIDVWSGLLDRLQQSATSMAVLLDEADAIPILVLESIASHFAADPGEKPAVSILLCGQPELQTRLRVLGATASIATSIRLEPLHRGEVEHFIRHHLRAQAGKIEYQFSPEAVERIIAHCGGLPALINALCSRALFLTELENQTTVTAEMIDELIADKWMATGSPRTNGLFAQAIEAVPARTEKSFGNLFGRLGDASTPDSEVHAERPLEDAYADRNASHDSYPRASADALFAEESQSQAPDAGTEVDLSADDVMEDVAPPETHDDGRSNPPNEGFEDYVESAESTTTDHDADESAPMALTRSPSLGDLQSLDLDRLPDERTDEETTAPAHNRRLRGLDPDMVQGPSANYWRAPTKRRSRRRLFASPLLWLAITLLLAVAVGSVYVPKDRVTQAMIWIEAARSDIASWFAWSPSSAAIASIPPEQSTPPSSVDDTAALSQTREGTPSTGRTVESALPTPATPAVEVEVNSGSPRERPPALARPAEIYLPNGQAPRTENMNTALTDTRGDTTTAAVPPTIPPMEVPDPTPGRITTADDLTSIAEAPVSTSPNGSNSQPHLRSPSPIKGREDRAILLAIEAANLHASEHVVEIRGLPQGASLSVGRLTDGVWTVPVEELSNVALTPAEDSDDDIPLTLRLVRASDRQEIQSVQLTVSVSAVADEPKLSVSAADGDQFTRIPIQARTWLLDKDGSEQLLVTVSGLPDSVELSAGRRIDDKWLLAPADLAGLFMTPKAGAPSKLRFAIEAIATESSNGDRAVARRQMELNVVPAKR